MADERPDADLVELVRQRGDRTAYGELVRRYQGHAHALAYSLLGDWDEAEDAAQESFIRAYINLADLEMPSRFAAWLRRITFGTCVDRMRRFHPELYRSMGRLKDVDELESIPDPKTKTPLEHAQTKEMSQVVMAALDELPPKYRIPLTLFHIDGLSYEKVAEFLDLPVGTVSSLINRAKKRLKPALEAYAREVLPMVKETLDEHKLSGEFRQRVTKSPILEVSLAVAPSGFAGRYLPRSPWPCDRIMPLNTIQEILDNLDRFRKATGIENTRVCVLDEAMNHPEVVRIWRMLDGRGYVRTVDAIDTNGTRIAQDRSWESLLDAMKESGLRDVQLRLYGLEKTHDWLVGSEGAFRNLVTCAERCKAKGLTVRALPYAHKRNISELEKLHDYLGKLGIGLPVLAFQPLEYNERTDEAGDLHNTWADLEKLPLHPGVVRALHGVYKPEKEWVELAREDRLKDQRVISEGVAALGIDSDQNVYCGPACGSSAFLLGSLKEGFERLYKKLEQRDYQGEEYFESDSFAELGSCFGDPASESLHRFQSVWTKWVRTKVKCAR